MRAEAWHGSKPATFGEWALRVLGDDIADKPGAARAAYEVHQAVHAKIKVVVAIARRGDVQ
jgi:hypothetical protein